MNDEYLYEKRLEEMATVVGVVGFSWIVAAPTFFLLMSASEALYATLLLVGVSSLIVGTHVFLLTLAFRENGVSRNFLSDLIWGRPNPRLEKAVLTEQEFEFLSAGVQDSGFLGAWSTDQDAMKIAASLIEKGLITRVGRLPASEGEAYVAWHMTPRGGNAAFGFFIPAPGWNPWGNA